MKLFVLIAGLLCSAMLCTGQQFFEETSKDCGDGNPCLDCGDAVFKGGDLTQYFKTKLKLSHCTYPKQAGKILYWVNVDANGRSCVLKLKDGTLNVQLRNDIRRWINQAAWTAPAILGKPNGTTVFLRFNFTPKELYVDLIPSDDPDAAFHANTDLDSTKLVRFASATWPVMRFTYVEQMPRSGYDIQQYLSKTMHYSDSARLAGIEGRVVVKFVVNEDGHVSDAKAVRGIGYGCDEEAIRVVNGMPKWIPGKQEGKPVKVYFTLPITFKLDSEEQDPLHYPFLKKSDPMQPLREAQDSMRHLHR